MRLQIYVPQRVASMWDPAPGAISWQQFQKRLASAAGNITVLTGTGHWNGGAEGYATEPVFIVEALIAKGCSLGACHAYADTWALMREYAYQLLAAGEDSILIVQDNEPTLLKK